MRAMHLWVVGGDLRQAKLAELLAEDGHTVHTFALEKAAETRGTVLEAQSLKGVERADCVVLPLPTVSEGGQLMAPLSDRQVPVTQVLDALRPGQLALGGRLDGETLAAAQDRGILLQDYFLREELTVANAVPGVLGVWPRIFRMMAHRPP